jgi:hypothetical protein
MEAKSITVVTPPAAMPVSIPPPSSARTVLPVKVGTRARVVRGMVPAEPALCTAAARWRVWPPQWTTSGSR